MMDKSKTLWLDGKIVPLSNFAPRGFGFVHHSIAIFYHVVPNPNITIRNFWIAVQGRGWRELGGGAGGGGVVGSHGGATAAAQRAGGSRQ